MDDKNLPKKEIEKDIIYLMEKYNNKELSFFLSELIKKKEEIIKVKYKGK